MKKAIVIALVLLVTLMSIGSALALNETEIQSIKGNVSIETQNLLETQTSQLQTYIDGVKTSLQGYNLTNDQINAISNSVSAQVKANVESACNPYLLENKSLANPLQKAMDGAISNAMDRKFLDQRDWIRETYIKSNDQFQQLTAERDQYKRDLDVARAQYGAAEIAANASYSACIKEAEAQREQSQVWIYLFLGVCAVLVLIMHKNGILRSLTGRKE